MEFKITFHRDGTVTCWNPVVQIWQRYRIERIPDEILGSMSADQLYEIRRRISQRKLEREELEEELEREAALRTKIGELGGIDPVYWPYIDIDSPVPRIRRGLD